MSPLLNDYRLLSPAERSLWRYPMMWVAALGIAVTPLLYATIYLGSSLDPYGNLQQLPVGLVNLDKGTAYRGATRRLGNDVLSKLQKEPRFHYILYPSEAAAHDAVQRGEAYFALTIPQDFSQKSLSGNSNQHGLLKFYVSEGGSYFASRVASTFADTLSQQLNATLGENRWDVVQQSLKKMQTGFADIRRATGQLRDGAGTLEQGAGRLQAGARQLATGTVRARSGAAQLQTGAQSLAGGVGRLTTGTAQLSAGLRQLNAAAPGATQLAPLQRGAAQVVDGAGKLQSGLEQLSAGAGQLAVGARSAHTGAQQLAAGNKQLAQQLPQLQSGLGQLSVGAGQLAVGARSAHTGAQQLAAGNKQLAQQLPQLQSGLGQARIGSDQLNTGAAQLATGAKTLREATQNQLLLPAKLKGGIIQIQQGAQQVHSGSNSLTAGLGKLYDGTGAAITGAQKLSAGATQLAGGTAQLQAGTQTLSSKLKEAQQGSGAAVTGAQKLSAGATQLAGGTAQLQAGTQTLSSKLKEAQQGSAQLRSGAQALSGGVGQLVAGNIKIKGALQTIAGKLPAQSELQQLSGGAKTLAAKTGELTSGLGELQSGAQQLSTGSTDLQAGARKLRDGLGTLYSKVPAQIEQLGGDPQGLSVSVQPVTEKYAAVKNNGAAFAPYFIALSLWVGCTLTTFIFPYQQLPSYGRKTGQLARMLRKYAVPAALVTVQALLVVVGVHLLGVEYLHPIQVTLTAVLSSLTFLSLVLSLIFLFGAAGRLFALVLLVLQLAASGGSYPIETAPLFFQRLHDWMPVTQSIKALRHAVSGAYRGEYPVFMAVLLGLLVLSVLLGLLGRYHWEYVKPQEFKPLVSGWPDHKLLAEDEPVEDEPTMG